MPLEEPSLLVREALTIHACWDDECRRAAWLEHLSQGLRAEALTQEEAARLATELGGDEESVRRWMDAARSHAGELSAGGVHDDDRVVEALRCLAGLARVPELDALMLLFDEARSGSHGPSIARPLNLASPTIQRRGAGSA